MRIAIFLMTALIFFTQAGHAYEIDESNLRSHVKTTVPPESRFEFVQSHIAAKNTFKVDKFSGSVFQIVQKADGDMTWEEIARLPHPADKTKKDQVNYQLFMSGRAIKFTFLINVWTGATWQLTKDSKTEQLFWDPIN